MPPSLWGVVGGSRGAGGRRSLCLGPSLCLPWLDTKAGFIGVPQQGVVSMLLQFVSACCRLDAVRGVPMRAGAGLQASGGHCWSRRVADWGRAAYRRSGAPPRVPRGFQVGRGGGAPLDGGGGTELTSPWPASALSRAWSW